MLRLTDTIGERLYQEEVGLDGMSEEDRAELKRREKRRLALGARAHL